jgi:hypothetical protein
VAIGEGESQVNKRERVRYRSCKEEITDAYSEEFQDGGAAKRKERE